MPPKKYKTFKEFYPFYLTEHNDSRCRALHFTGTTLFFVFFALGIITLQWEYFALMPVTGYGFAWIGHFFFEKNKPATFQYPFYSLGSDFVMYWDTLTGRLPEKMKRAKELIS